MRHRAGRCIEDNSPQTIPSKATSMAYLNTLRPRQNGRHFADDIFNCIFLNENVWIPINFSLKFAPQDPINNIPALVQIMAWRLPGDNTLSEPMMVRLQTHICVTRPQWVNAERVLAVTATPETLTSLEICCHIARKQFSVPVPTIFVHIFLTLKETLSLFGEHPEK